MTSQKELEKMMSPRALAIAFWEESHPHAILLEKKSETESIFLKEDGLWRVRYNGLQGWQAKTTGHFMRPATPEELAGRQFIQAGALVKLLDVRGAHDRELYSDITGAWVAYDSPKWGSYHIPVASIECLWVDGHEGQSNLFWDLHHNTGFYLRPPVYYERDPQKVLVCDSDWCVIRDLFK